MFSISLQIDFFLNYLIITILVSAPEIIIIQASGYLDISPF